MDGSRLEGDHHVRGLDDRIGLLADLQSEFVHRLSGYRGRDDSPRDIDADMGGRSQAATKSPCCSKTRARASL